MNSQRPAFLLPLLAAVLAVSLFSACGDDEDDAFVPPEYAADAVALDLDESRALFFSWRQSFETVNGAYRPFIERAESTPRLVHREQLVGENRRFSITTQPPSVSAFHPLRELNEAREHAAYGETMRGFDEVTFVLDLIRYDGTWLIDWQGLERHTEPQRGGLNFGLSAPDYERSIRDRLTEVIDVLLTEDRTIRVVLGAEMERYWLLNPEDWPNFIAFTRDTRDALAEDYPDVEFSVGINWSNFMQNIVPLFAIVEDEESGSESQDEATGSGGEEMAKLLDDLPSDFSNFDEEGNPAYLLVQLAWEAVIEPLYFDRTPDPDDTEEMLLVPAVDFLAMASIPDISGLQNISELPRLHWRGLRTLLEDRPERALSVDWYNIGWLADASAQQAQFLTRFLAEAGGLETRVTAWYAWTRLNQNECNRFTGPEIRASSSHCTRGLVQNSGLALPAIYAAWFD